MGDFNINWCGYSTNIGIGILGDNLRKIYLILGMILLILSFSYAICPGRNPVEDLIIDGDSCQFSGGNVNVFNGSIQVINGGELNLTLGVITQVNGTTPTITVDSTSVLNITDSSYIQSNETTNYITASIYGILYMDNSFSNETSWTLSSGSGDNYINGNIFRYCNERCILDSSDDDEVHYNDFYDYSISGLKIYPAANSGNYTQNNFYPTGTPTYAVEGDGTNHYFFANDFNGGSTAAFYVPSQLSGVLFDTNYFHNSDVRGFNLNAEKGIINSDFSQNEFYDNFHGISIPTAENITFNSDKFYDNEGDGLWLADALYISIDQATFDNNNGTDIGCSEANNINITGSTFIKTSTQTNDYGAYFYSDHDNYMFENNFYNYTASALYTRFSENNTFDSNIYYNCSQVEILGSINITDSGSAFATTRGKYKIYQNTGIDSSNVYLLNFICDLSTTTSGYCLDIYGSNNVTIDSIQIKNYTSGILVNDSYDLYINNPDIGEITIYGILAEDSYNLGITGGNITDATSAATLLRLFQTDSSLINNTYLYQGLIGLELQTGLDLTIDNVTSDFSGSNGFAYVDQDNLLSYNTNVSLATSNGIYIFDVTNSNFYNDVSGLSNQFGLYIDGAPSSYINFYNLNISGNGGHNANISNSNDILFDTIDSSVSVAGNGMLIDDDSENITILDSTFLSNNGIGINFESDYTLINNSYIWESGSWQIYSNDGDYSNLTYNNITSSIAGTIGILWSNGDNNLIDNNDIWNLEGTALEDYWTNNLTVSNNFIHNITDACWMNGPGDIYDLDNNMFTLCNKDRADEESIYSYQVTQMDSLNDTLYDSLERGWVFNQSNYVNMTQTNITTNDYINLHLFNSSNISVKDGWKEYAFSIIGIPGTFGIRSENTTDLNIDNEFVYSNDQGAPAAAYGISVEGTTNGEYIKNCNISHQDGDNNYVGLYIANEGSIYLFDNNSISNNGINVLYTGYNFTNSTFTNSDIREHGAFGIAAYPDDGIHVLGYPSGIYIYNTTIDTPAGSFSDILLNTTGLETYVTNMTMNFTQNPTPIAGGGITYFDISAMMVRWYNNVTAYTSTGALLAGVFVNATNSLNETEYSGTTDGSGELNGQVVNQYSENLTGIMQDYDNHTIYGTLAGYTGDTEITSFYFDNNGTVLTLTSTGGGTPSGGGGGGSSPKTPAVETKSTITFTFTDIFGNPVDSADVIITSEDGTEVFSGELFDGETFELLDGIYNIEVSKEGYLMKGQSFVISGDQEVSFNLISTTIMVVSIILGLILTYKTLIEKKSKRWPIIFLIIYIVGVLFYINS